MFIEELSKPFRNNTVVLAILRNFDEGNRIVSKASFSVA